MEGNLICSSLHFISGVEAKRTCVHILLQYYRDGYYRAPNYTPFRFILKDIPGFAEGGENKECLARSSILLWYIDSPHWCSQHICICNSQGV